MSLDFNRYKILTFDCYGTLIDWESGIFSALRPILKTHGKSISDAQLLAMYGELEAQAEQGEFRCYRDVLQLVVSGFGKQLGFEPSEEEKRSLPESLQNWLLFADTVKALERLKSKFKLAIISNVDDDLFAATARRLKVNFDHVITAQQARCYKPGLDIFKLALKTIGIPPEQILHCAQSVYHDVIPARPLGMSTVWVNRPSPRAGVGAVKPATGQPDLQVSNLETLANLALAGS
ncbi:MAG TPA: haloacid dehalogenase type II [Terriglobales bacterium]|nr:haloacid dehalogenase type II [Terriglobales bacterium]